MKTSLLKGLNEADKDEIKGLFTQAARLRAVYVRTLEEKLEASQSGRVSADGYDSPAWAFRQADASGYERAIREFISLLEK